MRELLMRETGDVVIPVSLWGETLAGHAAAPFPSHYLETMEGLAVGADSTSRACRLALFSHRVPSDSRVPVASGKRSS